MKKTKNNKGFSLVELIVVVLILGILAVAVTPQVMKWVGKSKISADKDSANALKSAITTALADWQAQDNGKIPTATTATNLKVTDFGKNNTAPTTFAFDSGSGTGWSDTDKLINRIKEVTAGDYPFTKYDNLGFDIEIEAVTGKVTINYTAKTITE